LFENDSQDPAALDLFFVGWHSDVFALNAICVYYHILSCQYSKVAAAFHIMKKICWGKYKCLILHSNKEF